MLVTTVGSQDSNSYLTLIEANDYFSAHPNFHSVWQEMPEERQVAWLRQACRVVDQFATFRGTKQYSFQSLEFPRVMGWNRGRRKSWTSWPNPATEIADNMIPTAVKDAQAEAVMFLVNNQTSAGAVDTREIASQKLLNGLVETSYSGARNLEAERVGGGTVETVRHLLRELIEPIRWQRG